jgi:hypothetical protein
VPRSPSAASARALRRAARPRPLRGTARGRARAGGGRARGQQREGRGRAVGGRGGDACRRPAHGTPRVWPRLHSLCARCERRRAESDTRDARHGRHARVTAAAAGLPGRGDADAGGADGRAVNGGVCEARAAVRSAAVATAPLCAGAAVCVLRGARLRSCDAVRRSAPGQARAARCEAGASPRPRPSSSRASAASLPAGVARRCFRSCATCR